MALRQTLVIAFIPTMLSKNVEARRIYVHVFLREKKEIFTKKLIIPYCFVCLFYLAYMK